MNRYRSNHGKRIYYRTIDICRKEMMARITAREPVEGYQHYPRNKYNTLERKLHI